LTTWKELRIHFLEGSIFVFWLCYKPFSIAFRL